MSCDKTTRTASLLRMLVCYAVLPLSACRCSPKATPAHDASAMTEPKASSRNANADVSELPVEGDGECPPVLSATRQGGLRMGSYVTPNEDERAKARTLMAHALRGESLDEASSLGFEAAPMPGSPDVVLLREREDKKRGGGAYLVRKGSTSSLVVQAPHTFFDTGTLPLAYELFQRSKARALFINTTHRYKSAAQASDGSHPSDVAHAADSLFQAMTEGAAQALPKLTVVQVHGFAERVVTARAVVSSGEKKSPPAPIVVNAASALEAVVGPRVLKYPDDTKELGATTNVQGAFVRRAGGTFLHVEMDDRLRKELLANAALRASALDALARALGSP